MLTLTLRLIKRMTLFVYLAYVRHVHHTGVFYMFFFCYPGLCARG